MFTKEQEEHLRHLHERYVTAVKQNYPSAEVFDDFGEVVSNIIRNGDEEETSLYELVKGVLDAMVYTSENSVEGMIERAEKDFPRRYAEMSDLQKAVVDRYRIPYNSVQEEVPWKEFGVEDL
jgi:hypothetical protein